MAEIQSDVSAILLELIHMEVVLHLSRLDHKECQVCRNCCHVRFYVTCFFINDLVFLGTTPLWSNEFEAPLYLCRANWSN